MPTTSWRDRIVACRSATISVSDPMRPIIILIMIRHLPMVLNVGVTLSVIPSVANAETASNNSGKKLHLVSVISKQSVVTAIHARLNDTIAITLSA